MPSDSSRKNKKALVLYCEPCHMRSVLDSGGSVRLNISLDSDGRCSRCGQTMEAYNAAEEKRKKKRREDEATELELRIAKRQIVLPIKGDD